MNLKKIIKNNQLTIPDAPLLFFLDLTERCNLKCWFCYNGNVHKKAEASFEDVVKILNIMHSVSCNEIIYLGGEPTLHSRFFDILDYAEDLGFAQTVVTNGQILNHQFVNKLKKYSNFEVGISIHSCDSSIQNRISGSKFAFNKLDRAIGYLSDLDINWYSQTSLIKENHLQLRDLYQFLLSKGNPSRIDLSRMVVKNNCKYDFLDENGYIEVFKQLNVIDNKIPIRIEAFPRCWLKKVSITNQLNYEKLLKTIRPCYAWVAQVSVDIYGNVRLCPTGGCIAGNLLKDDIKSIWNKAGAIKQFQKFLWQKKECLSCSDFPFCLGGCKMTNVNFQPSPDKLIVNGGIPYACLSE